MSSLSLNRERPRWPERLGCSKLAMGCCWAGAKPYTHRPGCTCQGDVWHSLGAHCAMGRAWVVMVHSLAERQQITAQPEAEQAIHSHKVATRYTGGVERGPTMKGVQEMAEECETVTANTTPDGSRKHFERTSRPFPASKHPHTPREEGTASTTYVKHRAAGTTFLF